MGETFKRTIPHVTTLSMTRKQIKEKTAHLSVYKYDDDEFFCTALNNMVN